MSEPYLDRFDAYGLAKTFVEQRYAALLLACLVLSTLSLSCSLSAWWEETHRMSPAERYYEAKSLGSLNPYFRPWLPIEGVDNQGRVNQQKRGPIDRYITKLPRL